jgi:hypothetical protein
VAVERIAAAHARRQAALARRAAAELARLWQRIDRGNIAGSWRALLPQALAAVSTAQAVAAASSSSYVADVADEYGAASVAAGRVNPGALAGIASDGRDLASLIYEPAITALGQIRRGATPARALTSGGFVLDMIGRTQVADAGRAADSVAIVAHPHMDGYVRMLVGKSCSRCVVLAGRRYKWNAGFRRHPRCDCRHIPVTEDTHDALVTNPRGYFDSLSEVEQDKAFTRTGAQAIRDGADIGQVVNARRGAAGLTPAGARITGEEARTLRGGRDVGHLESRQLFGQDLFVTTEGTTVRGVAGVRLGAKETGVKVDGMRNRRARAPRLMPESIYAIAGENRDEAIRLLRRNGYIR